MEFETKLIITLVVLHILSWGYNALIGWLERQGYHDGFVSLFVVGGVAYTVAITTWIIGVDIALILLAAFSASGFPMVVGSIARHIQQRKQEEECLRKHARRMNGR
jgi:hypothetical protein